MKRKIGGIFILAVAIVSIFVIAIKSRQFFLMQEMRRVEESIYKKASSPEEGKRQEAIEDLEKFSAKFSGSDDIDKVWYTVAGIYQMQGDFLRARDAYQRIMCDYADSEFISEVQEKLWDLNIEILFSPLLTEGDIVYKVKAGDTLDAISKKFNTTVELIMKSNNLEKAHVIRPGEKLKISTAKHSVIVDKSLNTLTLKLNGRVIKSYNVSTGKNNFTPVGTFKIVSKIVDPSWRGIPPGDPRNILGSRWLGFAEPFRSYGIHGTIDPESIGKHATEGCVRMLNEDVEELFAILPLGAEVVIIE